MKGRVMADWATLPATPPWHPSPPIGPLPGTTGIAWSAPSRFVQGAKQVWTFEAAGELLYDEFHASILARTATGEGMMKLVDMAP
jgi:hypothetical protein